MATLFLPLQFAVATGVIFTVILYVFRSAEKVRIERIVPLEDGGFAEGEVPEDVPSGEMLIIEPVGSLFFAGVAEFEEALPTVGDAAGAVVIMRLRDRDDVGSTFIRMIERYAGELQAAGNCLMLEGLSKHVQDQLESTQIVDLIGRENLFLAQPRFGGALNEGIAAAQAWMADALS